MSQTEQRQAGGAAKRLDEPTRADGDKRLAELRAENAKLQAGNAELQQRLEELERRLGLDSNNSSKPPAPQRTRS